MSHRLLGRRSAWVRTIHSEYPSAFWLFSMLIGQMLSVSHSITLVVMAPPLIIGFLLNSRGLFRGAALALTAGFLSGFGAGAPSKFDLPPGERNFLVRLIEEPRRVRVGEVTFVGEILSWQEGGKIIPLTYPPRIRCKAVDLPWRNTQPLQAESIIWVQGKLSPIIPDANPLSYKNRLIREGISAACSLRYISVPAIENNREPGLVDSLRVYLNKTTGNNEATGFLLSSLFGVRDTLTNETEKAFKSLGLTHVLVVSGYQVSLLFGIIVSSGLWLSRRVRLGSNSVVRGAISLGGLISVAAYVFAIGADTASLRAAIALIILIAASISERRKSLLNSIFTSLLLMSLIFPGCILDLSVQLTFAALFGIALGGYTFRGCSRLVQMVGVPLIASFLPFLVSFIWFGTFPLLGLILNPLVVPVISILTGPLLLLALLTSSYLLDVSDMPLNWILHAAKITLYLAKCLAKCPWIGFTAENWGLRGAFFLVLSIPLGLLAWQNAKSFVITRGLLPVTT